MSQNKIKVVWICHFTNEEMQSLLPVSRHQEEFAPWIPNLLKGFENLDDVEIHVISPHDYLQKTSEVVLRNIHYYFVPYGIPIFNRHWPNFFRIDVFLNFYFFRKKIKKIVKNIKPDLINLFGTENSYYSASALDFKNDYPVLVMIQGFITEFKDKPRKSIELRNRIKVEEEILRTFKYFCGEQDSSSYASIYNPVHIFFKIYFPVNEDLVSKTVETEKKYDCIYFGRLEKPKGAEDFIKVISEIKQRIPDVKGCVIGSGNLKPFIELSNELGCHNNIEFVGFVNSQKELFEYVKTSKVFLAPPYKERLSATIREAMLLQVPIVAYATGGIPYINEFDENIFLVETGNFKEMASKTILLLENENLAKNLANRAYDYGIKVFSLKENTKHLLNAYHIILKQNNTQT
jgi:glycosyltransferase involved in cell wall biosynthesis